MMYAANALEKEEHRQILEQRILPAFNLDSLNSHHSPKAILLVASEGVPTARISSAAYAQLRGDVVRVEVDELAAFHPHARELQRRSPITWRGRLQSDTLAWCEWVISAAMNAKKHLIVDTTSTEGSWASVAFVEALQASNYRVELLLSAGSRLARQDALTSPDLLSINLERLQHRTGVKVRLYCDK